MSEGPDPSWEEPNPAVSESSGPPASRTGWSRWSLVLAPLALALWIGYFLAPALAPGRALLGVDLLMRFPPWDTRVSEDWEARNHLLFDQAVQFYPWRLLTRSLAAAHLPPLWNPYAGTGSPLLANYQSATLAPVELAVSGLDPTRAPAVATAIRLAIAGVGMLLLLHRLGLPALAAGFGTLAFLGSGAITILLYHPNSNAAVWLPFVALLSYDLARPRCGNRGWRAALLALVLGAQLLGGHPETSLYVSLASALFFLFGLLGLTPESRRAGAMSAIGLWILAHVGSAAIAAPQILPFLEYLRVGAVLEHRGGTRFFNPPTCAAGLILPEIFGTPTRPNTYFGPRNYHAVATQYAGMATFFLALFAVVMGGGRRKLTFFLGLTLVLTLLLVYPTPVWRYAGEIPLFRISANVTGLTLLAGFLLAILGAAGFAALTARRETRSLSGRGLALLTALFALGLIVAWIILPMGRERILALGSEKLRALYEGVSHAKPIEYYMERLPRIFDAVRRTLLREGILAAVLAYLIATAAGRRRGVVEDAQAPGRTLTSKNSVTDVLPTLAAIALILHLAVDLSFFGRGYVPAIPRSEVFPRTAELDSLSAAGGVFRVLPTGRTLPPNTLTAYGIEDFRVHDAIGSAAHQRLESAMSAAPFMRRPVASYDRALLDVAGVDMLLAEPSDPNLTGKFDRPADWPAATVPDSSRPGIVPVKNRTAWPRAIFCMGAQEAASDSAALADARRAATGSAPPGETFVWSTGPPDTVAITGPQTGGWVAPDALWWIVERLWPGDAPPRTKLEREGPIAMARRPAADNGTTAPTPAGQLHHGPLRVTAAIEAPWKGWLVLLDQDFPGWRVTVDGQRARAARAFGLFRAVEVPAGRHEVVWEYRPLSFALGLALALPAMAIAVVAGAVSALRRRR